jgi:hypothetical protein
MTPFTRAYDAKLDVSEGERSVVARICTDVVDDYETVVDPAGADLTAFRKNPMVLWAHGLEDVRGTLPVGRCAWVKYSKPDKALISKTIFETDPFSDALFRWYQAGVLRGFSVFGKGDPEKCSPPSPAEIRARPDLARCLFVYRSWTLKEYSAVSLPGNAEALALAVSRGLEVPEILRSAFGATAPTLSPGKPPAPPSEPELPPLVARSYGEVHAALRSKIAALPIREEITRSASELLDFLRGRV